MDTITITADVSQAVGRALALHEFAQELQHFNDVSADLGVIERVRKTLDDAGRKIHEANAKVIRICTEFRNSLYAFLRTELTPEALRLALTGADILGGLCEHLLETLKPGPLFNEEEFQALSNLADDFDDLKETLALGLNEQFGAEVENAKRQALS